MRKLVYSALALTLVSVPGFASENEWSSLDKEIANLSSSLSAQNAAGPKVGGYIRTSFRWSKDDDALFGGPPNDKDESGFKLDKVRLEITGDANQDYSYKVSFELRSGTASLRDAYVAWKVADNFKATMGRFKKPVLQSGLISDKNLLFMERTALGGFFDVRDTGAMLGGNFDTIEWSIAAQNGLDGKQTGYNYAAHLGAALMGSGAGKRIEGAYGAAQDTNLSAGVSWADDKSIPDADVVAGEFALTSGPFSIAGEAAHFGKGDPTAGFPAKDGSLMHLGSDNTVVDVNPADKTSWDLTASYMFTPEYEAAIRYQDVKGKQGALPDDPSVQAWSACVNKYVQGHDIKWTLQYLRTKSDENDHEVNEWTLGLTVGI